MTDPRSGHASAAGNASEGPEYSGPPPNTRPPRGWQVPQVVTPAPPRELPRQDHRALDAEESRARTLTHGVGILAGALMFVVLIVILVRGL